MQTTNMGLRLPDDNDFYDVNDFNANFSTLEREVTSSAIASGNHANARNNPHAVTAAQVGAANATHNHDASNINTGTLSVARGGTGRTAITGSNSLRNDMGLGTGTAAYEPIRTTATQAEAEAGTATTVRGWTAQRVRQAVNAVMPTTVTQADAEAGTSTTVRGWTAQRVRQAVNAVTTAISTALNNHTGSRSNPHAVTAAQVGGTANLTTATQAEAEAGTATTVRGWTAQRIRQAVNAVMPTIVTQADAEAGISTTVRGWTAQRVRQAVNAVMPMGISNTSGHQSQKFLTIQGWNRHDGAFAIIRIVNQHTDVTPNSAITLNINGTGAAIIQTVPSPHQRFLVAPTLNSWGANVTFAVQWSEQTGCYHLLMANSFPSFVVTAGIQAISDDENSSQSTVESEITKMQDGAYNEKGEA
ncbi:MAG: hypothetical protein FWF76_00565 [Oscillospiraceae bacterium]|nr:hypothetical protein [Oscillospiraceae bacterium]